MSNSKSNQDNRSRQLNPEHAAYHKARDQTKPPPPAKGQTSGKDKGEVKK